MTAKELVVVQAALKQAQLYAVSAVSADEKQSFSVSLANYHQALRILREHESCPLLSPDELHSLRDRIAAYSRRVELIEALGNSPPPAVAGGGAAASLGPAAQLQQLPAFREERVCEEARPEALLETTGPRRVFWMLKTLHRAMTTGAFLTPAVYVHPGVWFQQLAKIEACRAKLGVLHVVLEGLMSLSASGPPPEGDARLLERFYESLCSAQTYLSQHVGCVAKSPRSDDKGVKALRKAAELGAQTLTDGAEGDEAIGYSQALCRVLRESAVLERWHASLTASSVATTSRVVHQALSLLGSVLEYLATIFLPVVLKDLCFLIDRYMRIQHALLAPPSDS